MHSPVTQIKERLTIADVIGGYIKLEKAGIHFKARCPFHNEKTPSFFVSSDRGSYHCFGCGRGGDIFTFVQEIEGVTFAEALKILATRAGVTLEKIDQKATDEFAGIYHALEEATRYYEMSLKE
jgi:DNA primase